MRNVPRSIGLGGGLLAAAALVVAVTLVDAADSQSPSFRLSPVTIDAAGPAASGASHVVASSLGQESVIGASSSPHFIVQSGFWSFLGSTMVPVVLTVDHTPGVPGGVDLSWSGNQASYDIYRSTDCATLFTNPLTATTNNDYTDSSPPQASLVCYTVLGEAPGPIRQPPSKE